MHQCNLCDGTDRTAKASLESNRLRDCASFFFCLFNVRTTIVSIWKLYYLRLGYENDIIEYNFNSMMRYFTGKVVTTVIIWHYEAGGKSSIADCGFR